MSTIDLGQYQTFRVAACDLNGRMRGKRVPGAYAAKLNAGAVRMPVSTLNLDIFGSDIAASPLVFASGDADGVLLPTERGPLPTPWLDTPQPLVPMSMYREDGRPYDGDPRHALTAVLDRYAARGWQVVAATELEFHLVDDSGDTLHPALCPETGRAMQAPDIVSMEQLDKFDPLLCDVYRACEAMGIAAQTTTSEAGLNQFEITIQHQAALRAADDAWLLKRVIRRLARKHGLAATFMAKPFAHDSGNGMHMHFSVLDSDGQNVFDDGSAKGSETLRQAIAGTLAAMQESSLIFAPHANSYARLVPGAHAPTGICWGYENRTVAVRVPGGAPEARRIEHRVAGGDINPYLSFAAILGAALVGVEDKLEPPPAIDGNAYEKDLPQLAGTWQDALDLFLVGPIMQRIFPATLIENLGYTKRQELQLMQDWAEADHWKVYLETV